MTTHYLEVKEDVLIDYAIKRAGLDGEIEWDVPDGYGLDPRDIWSEMALSTATDAELVDDGELRVYGEIETRVIVDRIRATWHHPAEVVTEDATVYYTIVVDMSDPERPPMIHVDH